MYFVTFVKSQEEIILYTRKFLLTGHKYFKHVSRVKNVSPKVNNIFQYFLYIMSCESYLNEK